MGSVRMGEMAVSRRENDELVALGLGSCIGLALVDRATGVVGLAHIVLPEAIERTHETGRYADLAVPELVARMLQAGASDDGIEAVLAGGARMFDVSHGIDIGARNEAAKQGELPENKTGPRRTQRLRTVDFSRPTKFTSDHQRRISRAIDTFCQTAVTRLSAELRAQIELETINTTQLTWSAAQAQLVHGALSAPLAVHPIGTRMLLTVEESFILMCLECLLGGSPDRPPRERRLSEIDWVLTRRLFESIAHQLSLVWEDLGGVSLELGEVEVHHDASQVASVSEPTFVVVIESRINKHSAAIALLIPWMAIEPIAQHIAGRERGGSDADSGEQQEIARAMAGVPVTLRAEVAAVELMVEDILELGPGSIIGLGARADQGVSLFAENVKLGRAHPGSNGARRAIQISGTDRRPA